MAGNEPGQSRSGGHMELKSGTRRRLMLGLCMLLLVMIVCVSAIVLVLQRLEARNANFQPPMTALERERLLPHEPILESSPQLQGMHYRESAEGQADSDSLINSEEERGRDGALSNIPTLSREPLHAKGESPRPRASQPRP